MSEAALRYNSRESATLALALPLALLGFGGLAVGWFEARTATLFAYWSAFCLVTAVALGGLTALMLGHVVRATPSGFLRSLSQSTAGVFPLLALLFLPIGWSFPAPYMWIRALAYFSFWILAAALLDRAPATNDHEGAARSGYDAETRERLLSAALLPPLAVTLTFAAFDWWLVSPPVLEPRAILGWLTLAALAALCSSCVAFAAWRLRSSTQKQETPNAPG